MNRNDFRSAYDKIVLPEDVRAEMKKKLLEQVSERDSASGGAENGGRFGFSRESAVPDVLWRSQAPLRRW